MTAPRSTLDYDRSVTIHIMAPQIFNFIACLKPFLQALQFGECVIYLTSEVAILLQAYLNWWNTAHRPR